MANITRTTALKGNVNAVARHQDFRVHEGEGRTVSIEVAGIADLSTLPVIEWVLATQPSVEATLTKTLANGDISVQDNVLTFVLTEEETTALERLNYYHETRLEGDDGEGIVVATGRMRVLAAALS